jgi:putative tryptophan/tyrosine transport system substrate-binding protein
MRATRPSRPLALAVFALLALGAAAAAELARDEPPPKKLPRIGALLVGSHNTRGGGFFFDELKALGYRAGENVIIEQRFAEGHDDRLDALAAGLVRDGVQVIMAQNGSSALAAQRATRTIPVVFVSISDPLALGLVQSLARPGGNITGIANTPNDLNQKRIEILKDALPGLHRIGIMVRAGNPNAQIHLRGEIAAAQRFGLQANIYDIAGPDDFDTAFTAMKRDGVQAIVQVQDSIFFVNRQRLADLAVAHGLPIIADGIEFADSRVLITYGSSYRAIYGRAALYIDEILHGAKPDQLPVDQPIDLRLIVNLKVARELGITVSRSMLVRANEVIE